MTDFSKMFDEILNKSAEEMNKGMETLDKGIKDLFETLSGSAETKPTAGSKGRFTVPSINIVETAISFRLEVAAPGCEKTDFKVQVNDNVLTIKSDKTPASLPEGETYKSKEFNYGSFERSFKMHETVDARKISATYSKGILYITLGKKDEAIKKPGIDIEIS